ncbi:PaaI family thioesterase [Streptomyces sp. LUP47B]|uniref:PaaI family thioesterase n=1 Tax=Streptomyces sp. LUP47B TaxID=1890286 RepID=UPI0008519A32|nr:PaaI family thioesterase [Streptomyces sp. LUP47B]
MTMTPAEADKVLADNFAPWVLDLGLSVETLGDDHAVLRLPWSQRLAREGGALSGQALMAAADTATVIAVSAARGAYGPMTTVQQSTGFQRAVSGSDVLIKAVVTKLGRRMAFADITMTESASGDLAARASTVCALLG